MRGCMRDFREKLKILGENSAGKNHDYFAFWEPREIMEYPLSEEDENMDLDTVEQVWSMMFFI